MTDPLFPFEIRLHRDAFSVHKVHHVSLTDPVLADPDKVKAWHVWRQFDSLTAPTKYKDWQRNSDNTDWLFLNAWHLEQEYADGQVPVADADGYFLPGDAGGAESGGPIDGAGTGGLIAKWADSNTLEDSSLDENTSDITSTKPLYLPAGTTSVPSLRVPHGSAPTSPTNGDLWSTTAGFFGRVNGATVGPFAEGGGGGWTQVVDEDGTTSANFTGVAGTWNSTGTVIRQTDISASWKGAILTAKQCVGAGYVLEADVKIVSGSSGLRAVGLLIGTGSAIPNGGPHANLRNNSGNFLANIDRHNVDSPLSVSFAFSEDTFYTLRFVSTGGYGSIFVDGVLVGGANLGHPSEGTYIALLNYNCEAHYQNILGWRLLLPGE